MAHLRGSGLRYSTYLWASTSLSELMLRFSSLQTAWVRAARAGIPVLATRNIADASGRRFLETCDADLLVSAFFDQRIDEDLARMPGCGAVNIHPSLLPDFKGVDPVFFARLRGHRELGVTVHLVSPQWDAGPVLCRETMAVREADSVFLATARLYDRGAQLLAGALDAIRAGEPGATQALEGCYDSWPRRDDVAALGRRGIALVRASDLGPRRGLAARARGTTP